MYEIIIIKEGYCKSEDKGAMKAGGTITLLKGPSNIMVDTGSPWDKDVILKGLEKVHLTPSDIQYCVCTHGHSDHCGNMNLFTEALHILGFDICKGDNYILHDFKEGIPYEIDNYVEVWPTPGHTGQDVSVVVKKTSFGTVAVVGDLFECEEDMDCPSLWQENSERPEMQQKCRINILQKADYIVPGHGPMFPVPVECKKQMRVVMITTTEEFHSCTTSTSKSECVIVETD